MYTHCIFCSADLGRNQILPSFPIGTHLAVDARKGRLWAVCSSCGRWNLAPIEERWEPVELAEEAYHATRLRVSRDNIGSAQLADGTRLTRIGDALQGDTAAWRYGSHLKRRRSQFVRAATATGAVTLGAAAVGLAGWVSTPFLVWGGIYLLDRRAQQIVGRLSASTGTRILRRWHVPGISVIAGREGPELLVRDSRKTRNWATMGGDVSRGSKDLVNVKGNVARDLLARALLYVNTRGASDTQVRGALNVLQSHTSPDVLLNEVAKSGAALGDRAGYVRNEVPAEVALAMEMAVHEATERLALEGELSSLRAAWAEAEEIAAIADSLPFLPRRHQP